jgi:alginate production protein
VTAALGCALLVAQPVPAMAEPGDEEQEVGLQQRLTEREDKRRPREPFYLEVLDHPLVLGGEYEMELGYVHERVLEPEVDGIAVREPDRFAMAHHLVLEAFYTIGEPLSGFVQVEAALEEDLLGKTFEGVSDLYLERQEMWLYSEDVLAPGVSADVGRLSFEDDRRWWWDDELDAVRLGYERRGVEIALAMAYEVASDRSDRSRVDPEQDGVLRWIGEASWDYCESHSFQLFLLHQDDHSSREQVGQSVSVDRMDESDARLTWVGARQTGVFDLGAIGHLGYWLDAGGVRGHERLEGFGTPADGRREVDDVARRDVSGWGIDAGLSWLPPLPAEPRVFAGYALGSGDSADGRNDGSYRQTDLQANEAGFGGVERFPSYGLLLRPELSNIGIVTAGAGVSLLRSSSLDLVYHGYRLVDRSGELGDIGLELDLDHRHRQLGHSVDLVLAVEEWERLEFDAAASVLRTGPALAHGSHRWVVGGFLAVRYGF